MGLTDATKEQKRLNKLIAFASEDTASDDLLDESRLRDPEDAISSLQDFDTQEAEDAQFNDLNQDSQQLLKQLSTMTKTTSMTSVAMEASVAEALQEADAVVPE